MIGSKLAFDKASEELRKRIDVQYSDEHIAKLIEANDKETENDLSTNLRDYNLFDWIMKNQRESSGSAINELKALLSPSMVISLKKQNLRKMKQKCCKRLN